jgi:hypothetical protein
MTSKTMLRVVWVVRSVLDSPIRRSAAWSRMAAIVLAVWVLAANVYGDFTTVRVKVSPMAATSGRLDVSLASARRIGDPYVVLIYGVRNTGTAAVTMTARAGDQVLDQSIIRAGDSARVDVAWPRAASAHLTAIELTGTPGNWRIDSLELANRHGFNRGVVEFLILPRAQPFGRPPGWLYALLALSVVLVFIDVPIRWPRWGLRLHSWLVTLSIILAVAAAVSPALTPFRLVLATHTVASGALVIAAPRALALAWLAVPYVIRSAGALLRMLRRAAVDAASAVDRLPWRHVVSVAACGGYIWLVWANVGAYAGGADQSGYLNTARLLSGWHFRIPARPVPGIATGSLPPLAYAPLGLRPLDSETLVPTYPIGVPLTIAAAAQIADIDDAAHRVVAAFAVAGVALCVWLARMCGLSPWAAMFAALILGTSPLYLFMSLQLMSDTAALVWVTAAVVCGWQSRQRGRWALLAGASLSLAVLTRPTNILALAPVALSLGLAPRRWLLLAAGGLPGAAMLLLFNRLAYGTALTTGYGDLAGLFALANVTASVRHYATYLPVVLTPLGVLAVGLPLLRQRATPLAAVLLAWIAAFLAFYAFYFYTYRAWWFLRFVLPALPPLIVGSLLVARALLAHTRLLFRMRQMWSRLPVVAGVLLTVLVLAHNAWWGLRFFVLDPGRGERVYADAAAWARRYLPPQTTIVAMQVSGALFYYTDFPVVRWDFLDEKTLGLLQEQALDGRRPLYAVLFPFEIDDRRVFIERLRGPWTRIAAVDHVTFWRFGPAPGPDLQAAEPIADAFGIVAVE